jgi:hypothetical protein
MQAQAHSDQAAGGAAANAELPTQRPIANALPSAAEERIRRRRHVADVPSVAAGVALEQAAGGAAAAAEHSTQRPTAMDDDEVVQARGVDFSDAWEMGRYYQASFWN